MKKQPAFRVLEDLERRHPLFPLSTKRNRDIADRPKQVYGKLRPTKPGEYLVMDTTRLDVFAFDPFTLKWVQVDLTLAWTKAAWRAVQAALAGVDEHGRYAVVPDEDEKTMLANANQFVHGLPPVSHAVRRQYADGSSRGSTRRRISRGSPEDARLLPREPARP